jgi:hypothetical protein
MTSLSKLKLVSVQADQKSPTISRRNRLTMQIESQIACAKASTSGDIYAEKKQKFILDKATGERKQVELSKRVKPWWFTASNGKTALVLRYGTKQIEIAKGKNAIEVENMDELISTLEMIKNAVRLGELDTQMEQLSNSLLVSSKKKKKAQVLL